MSKLSSLGQKAKVGLTTGAIVLGSAAPAFAEATPIPVDSVFSTVTTQVSTAVTQVLPYGAVILGALLAIKVGMKVYHRLT